MNSRLLILISYLVVSILMIKGCGTLGGAVSGMGKDLGSLGKLIEGDR